MVHHFFYLRQYFIFLTPNLDNLFTVKSSFPGGAIYVEGFPARQLEFENFERKFEVKSN